MSRKSSFGFVIIAAATAASVFACAYEVGPPVSVDGESPPGAPSVEAALVADDITAAPADEATPLREEEIAGLVRAIHREQAAEATLARTRAYTPALFYYADLVATDNTTALDIQTVTLNMRDLVPDDGPWVTSREPSEAGVARLNQLAGMAFDAAYLQRQLTVQSELLRLVDTKLALEPIGADLRAEVTRLRAGLVVHLERARALEPLFAIDAGP